MGDHGFPDFKSSRHSTSSGSTGPEIPPIVTGQEFVAGFVPPDYIVDGIIQRGRLYALTGITGHGKTAISLLLAFHISHGISLGEIAVERGPIVYLVGENPDDLKGRALAAVQKYGLSLDGLHFIEGHFPLTPAAAQAAQEEIDAKGIRPVGIMVDTAAAYFPGSSEIDNVEMGAYARGSLRVLTKCEGNPFVLVPCHPIKSAGREDLLPRGGGAFLNELDGNLTSWADIIGKATTLHWLNKLRGPDFQPVQFRLEEVVLENIRDRRGKPFKTQVAVMQTEAETQVIEISERRDEDVVLKLINAYPGISQRTIAERAGWVSKDKNIPNRSKVNRLLKTLEREKLVRKTRNHYHLTDLGKHEAA